MFDFSVLFEGIIFLPTALAALAFMFQTRHHNLHQHEKLITDEIHALREKNNPSTGLVQPIPEKDLKDELHLARRRYDFALLAFQCLMLSVCFMTVSFILKSHTDFAGCLLAISLALAALSFLFHICGDLFLAKRHQECIRKRTDNELNKILFPKN